MEPTTADRSPSPRAARSLLETACERLEQLGPRTREFVRHPSRAALAHGAAFIGIILLAAVRPSGLVSFVSAVALAMLLRSGRTVTTLSGPASSDAHQPTKEPS
jgi:hypothetical protein